MMAQGFQEPVGYLVPHVKPYAVNIVICNPVPADPAEIVDHLFVIGIQLGHAVGKSEGIVSPVPGVRLFFRDGPGIHHKPVRISGSPALLQHVQPRREFPSTMVKNRIHHDADSLRMGFLHQPDKIFLFPETGIDLRVVRGIVFMVGFRFHDRVKINAVNA